MKRTIQFGLGLATSFLLAGSLRANMAYFPSLEHRIPPITKVPVHIETSPDGPQARLIIPRKFLANVRSWAGIQPPGGHPVAWAKRAFPLGAGLALGLVLVPISLGKVKGRRLAMAIGLLLALCGTFFLSQTSRAHPPIGMLPPIPPFNLHGQVTVEVVDDGDAIRLILNKNQQIKYGPG